MIHNTNMQLELYNTLAGRETLLAWPRHRRVPREPCLLPGSPVLDMRVPRAMFPTCRPGPGYAGLLIRMSVTRSKCKTHLEK